MEQLELGDMDHLELGDMEQLELLAQVLRADNASILLLILSKTFYSFVCGRIYKYLVLQCGEGVFGLVALARLRQSVFAAVHRFFQGLKSLRNPVESGSVLLQNG